MKVFIKPLCFLIVCTLGYIYHLHTQQEHVFVTKELQALPSAIKDHSIRPVQQTKAEIQTQKNTKKKPLLSNLKINKFQFIFI